MPVLAENVVIADLDFRPAFFAAGSTPPDWAQMLITNPAAWVGGVAPYPAPAPPPTVDDLVAGAPSALDTLKELADALGDDANYAATVTAALATKATKLATQTKTANFAAQDGKVYEVDASGGAVTATIPVTAGLSCIVKKTDSSTNAVVLSPASGTIDGGASISMTGQQEARELFGDGTNVIAISERRVPGSNIQSVAGANAAGTSTKFAREDHAHGAETDDFAVHLALFGG